jgi:hypothetical protein
MSGKPVSGVEPGTGSFNLILKNLSLHSYLNVSNHISHPDETTGTIIVLYTLISMFFDNKVEGKSFCTEQ